MLLKLEKKILDNNLMIALETDLEPYQLKDFLKNFNKKTVTVNYDMGNSAYWEFETKKEFLCYGQSISNVHIKDCTPKDYTVQLGDGNVNFNEVFLLLKKIIIKLILFYKQQEVMMMFKLLKNNYSLQKNMFQNIFYEFKFI